MEKGNIINVMKDTSFFKVIDGVKELLQVDKETSSFRQKSFFSELGPYEQFRTWFINISRFVYIYQTVAFLVKKNVFFWSPSLLAVQYQPKIRDNRTVTYHSLLLQKWSWMGSCYIGAFTTCLIPSNCHFNQSLHSGGRIPTSSDNGQVQI